METMQKVSLGLFAALLLAACGKQPASKIEKFAVQVEASGIVGEVVLANNGTDLLSITSDGVYNFSEKLEDGAGYSVTVEQRPFFRRCTLSGASGTVDGADVKVELACQLKSWAGPDKMADPGELAHPLERAAAVWASGGAVAAWVERQGTTRRILARTLSNGVWAAAQQITKYDDWIWNLLMAPGPEGEAVLVWCQIAGLNDVYWSRLDAAGWSPPSKLLSQVYFSYQGEPKLALAPTGKGVLVWSQRDDNAKVHRIFASRYHNGAWSAAEAISPLGPTFGHAAEPAVAVQPTGDAVVAWVQEKDNKRHIYASRLQGGTWKAAEDLSGPAAQQGELDVAVNAAGQALVVWWRRVGSDHTVYAARYTGSAWAGPEKLATFSNQDPYPQAGLDDAGRGYVTWRQDVGGHVGLVLNVYENGWQGALPIDPQTGFDMRWLWHRLAVDASGNGMVAWVQGSQAGDVVYAFRIDRDDVYGSGPEAISAPGAVKAHVPALALGPGGDALAIWWQDDGNNKRFYTNAFY